MTITVEIPDNVEKQVQENVAHGNMEAARSLLLGALVPAVETYLINDKKQSVSLEEFEAMADKLADLAEEYIDPNFRPLSDYALSREAMYEGHPKL